MAFAYSLCGRLTSLFITQSFNLSATSTICTRTAAVWASIALQSSSI